MINFKAIPFLRILFPYLMGIVSALSLGVFPGLHIVCAITLVLLIGSFLFQKYYKPVFYLKKSIYIFSVNVFLFLLAFEACFLYNARNDPYHYTHYVNSKQQMFIGIVDDLPATNEKTTKMSLRLTCILDDGQWHYVNGTIVAYLKNDSVKSPMLGDRMLIKSRLSYINEPKNPSEFNYKEFLENRNIFHTVYVQSKDLVLIPGGEDHFSFLSWGTKMKSAVVTSLRHSGLSHEAFAICSALLVGYDDEIDSSLIQSFSHSGTLHILSVSGMHTGVLYGILIFLFSFVDKYDRYKNVKCIFVILSLLLFVAITGFSPSVLRAALMLSLVILGKTFYKQGNSYNTLLLSAFILLLINPYLIKDIGFLLSYLAVFGIMYFYPILSRQYMFQNKILQWLWVSVLISVSATLFTIPISLYYFHQFPTWFVFSNLIIIPISMVIMFGAILLVFFSKIMIVKHFLVFIVNTATSIMHWAAKMTDDPGYGFIDLISFSKFDMICCSFFLISFLVILNRKQYKQVFVFCLIILCWLSGSVYSRYHELYRDELVVFHVKNKTAFALKKGLKIYANFRELSDKEFQRIVKPWLLEVPGAQLINSSADLFKDQSFVFLNVKNIGQRLPKLEPDYILVSKDTKLELTINHKTIPVVIADCSNSYKFVKDLEKQCTRLGIPFYSIKTMGALKLKI